VEIQVDAALRGPESPEAPNDIAPFVIALDKPVSLIGRRNEARAIFPEIALPHDEAVSRRHALLQTDPQGGLLLRDIGAANGTRLNGKELEPMVDYAVKDGDEITLGHWSRLRVQAR
jgi:pSer/pThr/pTyr-binding forkhead associated (FHA) protein